MPQSLQVKKAHSLQRRVSPLTELLKRSDAQISAIKANKLLIELGILEEKEAPVQ